MIKETKHLNLPTAYDGLYDICEMIETDCVDIDEYPDLHEWTELMDIEFRGAGIYGYMYRAPSNPIVEHPYHQQEQKFSSMTLNEFKKLATEFA